MEPVLHIDALHTYMLTGTQNNQRRPRFPEHVICSCAMFVKSGYIDN
jgi:hypothetical protein